jgi:hypothetical protein
MLPAIQHTPRRVAKVYLNHHGLVGTTDGTEGGQGFGELVRIYVTHQRQVMDGK